MKRLAGYIRVSRVNGRKGDSFMSVDQQRETIEAWAKANGVEIVEWFEELDVSGGKASRPKLDALLAAIKAGHFDGMVVAKLDRASRSASGGLALIKGLSDQGKRFVSVAEGADPATRTGRLIMGILLVLAEWELEGRTEGWADVTARVNARGIHQGDAYGYTRIKGEPLTVNPSERGAVKLAFEMRARKASWKSIADALLAQGHMPRRAQKWSQPALAHMLKNRVYLGEATQGDDLVKKGAHPAIIDGDLFAAVQRVKGSSHARTTDWLLSGLVRCQVCRSKMRGNQTAYRCRHSGHAGMNAETLEAFVTERALDRHEVLLESAHGALDIVSLNEAVDAAEREVVAFASAMSASKRPELFAQGMQDREATLTEAEHKRDNALATYAPEGVGMIFSMRDEWTDATVPERREALAGLIDFIVVHPSRGSEIVWRGQGAALGAVPKTGGGQGSAPRVFAPFAWPLELEAGVASLQSAA